AQYLISFKSFYQVLLIDHNFFYNIYRSSFSSLQLRGIAATRAFCWPLTIRDARRFQWAHSMHHDKCRHIVNVEECVKKVREYRMHSVQSLSQFEYIYMLMLRHIFLVKVP
uniref:Tyrosine-protein phosphatase domain-containing protein n=1 Tax=Parascaris equorum TaxID=6256 RepID=A0A914RJA2_PAREQ